MSDDIELEAFEESARIVEGFIEGADDEIADLLKEIAQAIRDRVLKD